MLAGGEVRVADETTGNRMEALAPWQGRKKWSPPGFNR